MSLPTQLRYSALMAVLVWVAWFTLGGGPKALSYVADNWHISLTMIFGSMVAGGTSEGGGAVAFPFFTKVFHIDPWTAKLFSLCCQSVGMTTASLAIILLRIKVDWYVIRWASISGALGMLVGASTIAPLLPADVTKMTFTVMEASFAVALMLLNRERRTCHEALPETGLRERHYLLLVGFVGGVFSSIVGVGIDIVVFSMMVLLFRVSEKVATPTSVILMAINSLVGVSVYGGLLGQIDDRVFSYWMAAVPVIVVGAPLGAIACSYMTRSVIANILIGLIFIELASSLVLIPLNQNVVVASFMTLTICFSLFYQMYRSQRYRPLAAAE